MTVPPNYGPPPEQPQTPGYGYQSPYNGGQPSYGSRPPQPSYGGQPPYGQEPPAPYGGPVLPPGPPKRNLALIGGVLVGITVLVLGAALLITMNLRDDGTESAAEDATSSEEASEEAASAEEPTTEEAPASEVGQCLPYEPVVEGDGLGLVDCGDAAAFWEITGQSYEVTDVPVDSEGNLTDTTAAVELCGEDWGVNHLGETWTNWHYVYSSGTLDSLYCIKATGAPDPNEPEHLPYTPDVGDCFDEASEWWTVDCSSDLAVYKVVDTVVYDEPVEMTEDEAQEAATCGGEWYWQITDTRGRTSAIICANGV
ncbi:DUF3824 domain-containing protein [Glycomyces sp. TRM65418]|uniref:DUF3824 domain-containing protein n=1 Tax=Glycomyces sp. TRM65418 TaxID=2867006 RepID=UPI001CE52CFC|nr:DUF3824 domain-containing protein [Glycomyces sp. TRM65418]MCC3764723.1 DUF3824 domain-containing protein [Glycomyces sp. TRM65418]QZD54381.1 DUF3824 domain-containing protein [Glycomyces sp. TRM65418]